MSRPDAFELGLAEPRDEPGIRRLVGSVAMPGAIAVRFEREPDYFLGTTIMGDPCDVFVARLLPGGEVAGVVCRAERSVFVNGIETRVGYLGGIRIDPRFQGRWLLWRGLDLFRQRSPSGLLYLGVVAGDNPRARALLLERRPPGSLHADRIAGLTTLALMLRRRRVRSPRGLEVDPGTPDQLEAIVAFLRTAGSRRQLFPAYSVSDFLDGRTMRGLAADDLLVARRTGEIVGVLAAWDQSAYKQDTVAGYAPALARLRPAYDVAARVLGARRLPRVGERIAATIAACVCVAEDEPRVLRALLDRAMDGAWRDGFDYLMVGLADADPLLPEARRTLHVTYRSDLFLLSFSDPSPSRILDGRVPYIEIATL